MSYGSRPHLPAEMDSGAATCHVASNLTSGLGVGSSVATCPTAPCGPRVSSIKKSLAELSVELGTLVPNARVHVSKSPHVRAIMHLQDVRADIVVNTYKACGHASTLRRRHYGPLVWHRYSVK
jgi:hypothetical protein